LTSFGINYNPKNVLNVSSEEFDSQIVEFVKNIHVNAICADNDFTAYRILNILTRERYKVPEDISIIGFDNNFIFNCNYLINIESNISKELQTNFLLLYFKNIK